MARKLVRNTQGIIIDEVDVGPEPEEGAPTPEQRIGQGFRKQREDEKKKIAVIIARCESIAQKAKRRKDTTPALDFEAKLKTAAEVKALFSEYKELKDEACKMTRNVTRFHPEDDDFMRTVDAHFKTLDDLFSLEGNYGWRPLK